ncbi:MAG: exodeoxyribonuclease III [Candidatus Stygibacter australis]|nr:exodeoxyribonuclease III [Candidatus Stygibacter australis]MDP8321710.1 exodeoxyribonuclease III [Candidatus Stygibacter australis]
MKIISWNVNGLRAIMKKNFLDYIKNVQPDILCIQETKLQELQIPEELAELAYYQQYWSFAEKKGYSGTAIFTRSKPLSIETGLDDNDPEGRTIIADFDEFVLINCYFPNGKMSDERLAFKLEFYDKMLDKMDSIVKSGKNIIVCGDYNTAHKEIDLKNPKANEKDSGFLPIERAWLDKLVEHNYVDTFRYFDPSPDQYSWWSYRFGARERNAGWRIDYFWVNDKFINNLSSAFIQQSIMGSDHCPVGIVI